MKKIMLVISLIVLVSAISFIEPTNVLTIDDVKEELEVNDIPKFYFEGEILDLKSKNEIRDIKVKYVTYDKNIDVYAKIKLQGTSSIRYEKKNYTITFYEDDTYEEKKNLDFNFGWGSQNKYCLKANWIDKTHSRNIVTASIAASVQKKYNVLSDTPHNGTIDGEPVEIYLNNEFLGLYTLNIPKDDWLFNMDDDNPNHIVLSAANCCGGTNFLRKPTLQDWEVEVGEENDYTLEKLSRLSDFIRNSTDEEFKNNFHEYFNFDSILNYYVLAEIAQLRDNICKNMLLATYDGNIWYTSLYDLDTSWGTHWDGKELEDYTARTTNGGSYLFERFEKTFPNEIADRYFELRNTLLSQDNIIKEFEVFSRKIPKQSLEKENARWKDIPGYDYEQIHNFLDIRLPLTDKLFTDFYTYDSNVSVIYTRNSDGHITAKLINVRNDIILLNGDSYTFKENGKHLFYFINYAGEKDFIEIEVNCINKKIKE